MPRAGRWRTGAGLRQDGRCPGDGFPLYRP